MRPTCKGPSGFAPRPGREQVRERPSHTAAPGLLKNPAVPCSVLIPGGSWWPSHYKRLIPTPGVDPFSTGPCVKADSFWVLIPGDVGQGFRGALGPDSDLMSATHSKMKSAAC
jgi:hypothetical protein